VLGENHECILEFFRRPRCKEAAQDRHNVSRGLRFQPQKDHAIVRVAVPVSPVREIDVESHYRHAPFDCPTEKRLVFTPLKSRFRGVHDLMPVPTQGFCDLDANVLVKE
jgi:hypothetical protein